MTTALAIKPTFIQLRPAERKVFRKRKRLPGPQWVEKNIYVPIGSRQGLYRNHNNPAMYGVLDWATRHYVRTVVMAKGIQIGGTLAFYSLLLREGEYSADSALIVMADERSVKKLSKKRLQPMIDKSAALSTLKSGNPDDTTIYSITLGHGFVIDIGWASSEMSVSSESYRVVILDEISKYKVRGNIEDAKARTTVFPDTHRIWIFSSPGIDTDDPENRDPLMIEAESCDVMLDFHAICPDCGQEQVMLFDGFKWPGQQNLLGEVEADPKAIRRNKSAWYECTHCQSRWNDFKRDKALLAAMKTGWRPSEEGIEAPQSVYVHFPSWLSPFVSLSSVVADWLEAQGDEEKLRKWYNRHGAISYKYNQNIGTTSEETILKFRDEDLPRNVVPADTARLCILADTQQSSFYYEIWSYGYAPQIKMHMVAHGIVEQFEDLEGLLQSDAYKNHDAVVYRINNGLIDSGGTRREYQKHSRTVEVYEFSSRVRAFLPFKGMHGRTGDLVTYKDVATFPGTNKKIPGGLKRANIRVDMFKDDLERRLAAEPDDPHAVSFHADIDSAFAKHFTGETKDEHGDWKHTKRSQRIDYWDCAIAACALREMMKLRIPKKPEAKKEAPKPAPVSRPGSFVKRWK